MTLVPAPEELIRPGVSEADAAEDRTWFLSNPRRRYRVRRDATGNLWVIRRKRPLALLRTCTSGGQLPADRDEGLRAAWVAAAWPKLSAEERAELVSDLKKAEPAG